MARTNCQFCGGPLDFVTKNRYRNEDLCSRCEEALHKMLYSIDAPEADIKFVKETCEYNAIHDRHVPHAARR